MACSSLSIEVDRQGASGLYAIVERLTTKANLPMPRIYIIPELSPNAFATGRNPQNEAVAVTGGARAHELSHVRHYDILIGTIAATFGSRDRKQNPKVYDRKYVRKVIDIKIT